MAKLLKIVGGIVAAIWGAMVFMASNSPADVASRAEGWLAVPVVRAAPAWLGGFIGSPWTLAITFMAIGGAAAWWLRPRWDARRGPRFVAAQPSTEDLGAVEAPAGQAREPEDDARRRELIYKARNHTSILLEEGECRAHEAAAHIRALGKEDAAWHDKGAFDAREKFLEAARQALAVRVENGDTRLHSAGDYTEGQRKTFQGMLSQRMRVLVEYLEGRRFMTRAGSGYAEISIK